jgi:hypothetical protein
VLGGLRRAGVVFLALAVAFCGLSFLVEFWSYKVSLDGDALLISRFSKQVRVSLVWIVQVTGGWKSISIVFDRDTGLGTRIKFMVPPFFGPGQEQPLVVELRALAGLPR